MKVFLAANIIGVSDVKKASKWYADVFGMKLLELKPPHFCEMKLGKSHFLIEKSSRKRPVGFQNVPIGVKVSAIIGVDNIQIFINKCKKKGVKVINDPMKQPWGGWNAIIHDPDGNEFVIDQDEWD